MFRFDEKELRSNYEFQLIHTNCFTEGQGAIGGGFSFTFTPTSIGTVSHIKCNGCGEVDDITNYDNW